MSEREKDHLFKASTAKFGQNSKGNQRLQLYVTKEDAEDLAALIVQKASEGAGTGVKLDIHESKTELDDGRTISGAFFFCKSKVASQGARSVGKTYTPKAAKSNQAAIDKLRQKQVE